MKTWTAPFVKARALAMLSMVSALILTTPLAAQVVVGGPSSDGFLEVRNDTSEDALLLEVDATTGQVNIGTLGGDAVDGDLRIRDFNGNGNSFFFNGSNAEFFLGYGTLMDDGDAGALFLRALDGEITAQLTGANGALTLGGLGNDGDLVVRDNADVNTFSINGQSGDITQDFDGFGALKAWCRVNADGSFDSGENCTNGTDDGIPYPFNVSTGLYRVDFTALATDISSRPTIATCHSDRTSGYDCAMIQSNQLPGNASALTVIIRDENGALINEDFEVFIF